MEKEKSRVTQRGGYNREVEWYLTEVSRLMGERSNFGGLVAVIERGGTGGNSGTKGCGMIRVEPFENSGELFKTHEQFARAETCGKTWALLSEYARWILSARYCYTHENLPKGLHGKLGDLSAVAFVVAKFADEKRTDEKRKSQTSRLIDGAAKSGVKDSLKWADESSTKALEYAHALWGVCMAHVKTMKALEVAAVQNER